MAEKKLLAAFDLAEADLEANRAGRIGPTQDERLRRNQRLMWAITLLVGAVVLAVFLLSALLHLDPFSANNPLLPALLFSPIGAMTGQLAYQLGRDRQDGQLRHVDERIHLTVGSRVSRLQLGNRHYRISNKKLLALRDGEYYRAYLAQRAGALLAMEPLDVHDEEDDAEPLEIPDEMPESLQTETLTLAEDGELRRDEHSR